MVRTADIIVIGAGMAGLGAGARLAAEADVIVLERESQPGYHSTGRSAAMFIETYGGPVIRQLTRASRSLLEERSAFWPEPVLGPRGALYLARAGEERELDRLVEASNGAIEPLSIDDACAKVPILDRSILAGAAFEPDAQDMDVDAILTGFRKMLRAQGGEIICGSEVSALKRLDGTWQVSAGTETYSAPVVVNASGAWADAIARAAGLEPIGFRPCRRSAAIVPVPGYDVSTWPTTGPVVENFYIKPEGGKLMVSPADETDVEPHDAYADDMALAEGIDAFCRMITFEVTRVERTWGGLRTFSPDRTHVIGFDPRTDGFFWFAGQGGYGIQSAHGGAMLVAGLVLHDAVPPVLAELGLKRESVAPDRFLSV